MMTIIEATGMEFMTLATNFLTAVNIVLLNGELCGITAHFNTKLLQ